MKQWITALLACATIASAKPEDYRTFTSKDGQVIQARIISFNSTSGQLEVEREDGKISRVLPGVFSDEDQAYIKKWAEVSAALSDSNLKVRLDAEKKGSFGSKADLKEGETIAYNITVENRTKRTIEGLSLEYAFFINVIGTGQTEDSKRQVRGTLKLDPIEAGKKATVSTKDVEIVESYEEVVVDAGYDSNGIHLVDQSINKVTEDDMVGVWVRLFGPEVEGKPMFRDITTPDDLPKREKWDKE